MSLVARGMYLKTYMNRFADHTANNENPIVDTLLWVIRQLYLLNIPFRTPEWDSIVH